MKIVRADFIKSGTSPEHYPDLGFPEIAFAGRSNVGKSSLINSLARRKNLVKVSQTPGRTQTLNFFNINDALCLTDLPGYGYARVPLEEKESWGDMINTYLATREGLMGVVCIMDIRRGLQDEDWMLIEAMPGLGVQPILVFTKADKLKRNARKNRRHAIADEMGVKASDLLLYSAVDESLGRDALWHRICELTGVPFKS